MKRYLILGATSDISIAITYRIADLKSEIYLASRNVNRLKYLKTDIEIKTESTVHLVEFDACNYESHADFYSGISNKPDIVINMFGYLGEQKMAGKEFFEVKKIIETNYLGAVSILNIIAEDFEHRKSGIIVGVGSVAGDRGRQSNYIYGSAKSGVETYLSGLRNKLHKSGVHVCTIKPGFVDTRMTKGLDLPKLLTASPEGAAKDILKAIKKKKNIVYTKWFWKYIMLTIKCIPESIFKRLNL